MQKNKNLLLIGILSVIVVIIFTVSIITKMSYKNDLSQRKYIDNDDYNVGYTQSGSEFGYYYDKSVKTLEDLENYSDTILRISIDSDNERYYYNGYTVSEADVLDIYKGDTDDKIYILEPISYFAMGDYIVSDSGYYWIRDDDEYIVFLRELRDQHIGKKDKIYLPVTCGTSTYDMSNEITYYSNRAPKIYKQVKEKYE